MAIASGLKIAEPKTSPKDVLAQAKDLGIKIVDFSDYRPLTTEETARYVAGEDFGDVSTAVYLRMCALGGGTAPDGLYVKR